MLGVTFAPHSICKQERFHSFERSKIFTWYLNDPFSQIIVVYSFSYQFSNMPAFLRNTVISTTNVLERGEHNFLGRPLFSGTSQFNTLDQREWERSVSQMLDILAESFEILQKRFQNKIHIHCNTICQSILCDSLPSEPFGWGCIHITWCFEKCCPKFFRNFFWNFFGEKISKKISNKIFGRKNFEKNF